MTEQAEQRDVLDYENIAADRRMFLAQRNQLQTELNLAEERVEDLTTQLAQMEKQYREAAARAIKAENLLELATQALGNKVLERILPASILSR